MENLQEGDNVLCTVQKIEGTTVFVKIEDNEDGTIVVSEIAPGRIRNLREYVVPNKKIVCKILRIDGRNINLSLRRVIEKERKEVLDKYEKEKTALSILKSVLKEKAISVADSIKKHEKSIYNFLQSCKTNIKSIEKYTGKEEAERICSILQEKKEKKVEVKKEFLLKSEMPNGLILIKKILSNFEVSYLGSGKFTLKIVAEDYKKANSEVDKILKEIEANAKKEKCFFELKDK